MAIDSACSKTMQIYLRLAGVEVEGVTNSLKFTSPEEAMAKVVNLFSSKNGGRNKT